MFWRSQNKPEKLRKKVQRLRTRGRHASALDPARELCQLVPEDIEAWSLLADIAQALDMKDLALAALFEAARLKRIGPDEWLALAATAAASGFFNDAREARFQAADRFAIGGRLDEAIELLDNVLAEDPEHEAAARVRRVVARRLGRDNDDREGSISRLDIGHESSVSRSLATEEWTGTIAGWAPPTGEATLPRRAAGKAGDGEAGPSDEMVAAAATAAEDERLSEAHGDIEVVGRLTPEEYVLDVQFWPSVLDRRPLAFIGQAESLDPQIVALASQREFKSDAVVVEQADRAELLYIVDDGALRIVRDRDGAQDLGLVSPGYFCGGLGALVGLPSTTRLEAVGDVVVRIVERESLQGDAAYARTVAHTLRALYVETVADMCTLIDAAAFDKYEVQTFEPGQTIVAEGESSPLYVLVTGFAEVLADSDEVDGEDLEQLGYLCPADLAGEIDPSPTTVRAASRVAALCIERENLPSLPQAALEEVEARVEASHFAVEALKRR